MSNEEKKLKNYEDLKSFISNLVKDNPNDQILGTKIRHLMNNIDNKDIELIQAELKKINLF